MTGNGIELPNFDEALVATDDDWFYFADFITGATKKIKKSNFAGGGGGGTNSISFVLDGVSLVGVNQISAILPADKTIADVFIKVDIPPEGANFIVDIFQNGSTIFTSPSKRPEIVALADSDTSDTPDEIVGLKNDVYSVHIIQVGSTLAGGNRLYVRINFS